MSQNSIITITNHENIKTNKIKPAVYMIILVITITIITKTITLMKAITKIVIRIIK